jgi:HSP20 family protein
MTKVANTERKEKEVAVRETPHRGVRTLTPFEEMDRMFDRLFESRWMRPMPGGWPWAPEREGMLEYRAPRLDVIDRDDAVVVRAELPGVEKKDVEVSVTENTLTVRGKTERETQEEKGEYHRSEIVKGEFLRTITLPADVDGEKAKASLKDGVLELTLPKREVAKRRTVPVE